MTDPSTDIFNTAKKQKTGWEMVHISNKETKNNHLPEWSMCSHRLLLLLTQSQNCQGNPAKPHSHSLGITPCASLSTLLQNIPSQDTVTTMWTRFACFHVRPFFFDFGGKVHSSISKSPGLKFGPGCCFNDRLARKERIQTTSSKSCEGRRGETHGRCKQNVSDCIPDLPGPRKNPAGDGSGCITVSDDAVRDAGDDTVLYIIPGDSAAPYSRLWIEERHTATLLSGRHEHGGVGRRMGCYAHGCNKGGKYEGCRRRDI